MGPLRFETSDHPVVAEIGGPQDQPQVDQRVFSVFMLELFQQLKTPVQP